MLLRKARTFANLPARTRQAVFLMPLAVPTAAIAVRRRGFKGAQKLVFSRGRVTPTDAELDRAVLSHVLQGYKLGLRLAPYKGNCLSRSLALSWLLRRQGVETDLRIGVRHSEGVFQAHAWVEHDGRVLNDSADVASRYQPFDERFGSNMAGIQIREGQP